MKPAVPWSVKGVEPEAREAAKRAARASGMTLGAWLNQKILDANEPDAIAATSSSADPRPGPGSASGGEQDQMAESRYPSRKTTPAGDYAAAPYGAAAGDGVAPSLDALRRHLQDSESRTERTFSQISQALEAVLDKLDDAGDRRKRHSSDDSSDTLRSINAALTDVSQRLAQVERSGGSDSALERNIHELTRSFDKNEAQLTRRADKLEDALDKLRDKIDGRDDRRLDAVKGLERAVSELAQRQDKHTQNQADALRRTDQAVATLREQTATKSDAAQKDFDDVRSKVAQVSGTLDALHDVVSKGITKDDLAALEQKTLAAAKTASDETREALRGEMMERLDAAEARSADAIAVVAGQLSDLQSVVGETPDLSGFKDELNGQLGDIVSRLEVLNGEIESRFEHFAEETQAEIEALRAEMSERPLAALTQVTREAEPAAKTPPAPAPVSTAPKVEPEPAPVRATGPVERPAAPRRERPERKERPTRKPRPKASEERPGTRAWVWMVTLLFFAIGLTALAMRFLPSNEGGAGPFSEIQETPLPEADNRQAANTLDDAPVSALPNLDQMPTMTLDTTPDVSSPPRTETVETERTALPSTVTQAPEPTPQPVQSAPVQAPPQPAEIYAEAQELLEQGTATGDLAAARRLRTAADAGLVIAQYRLATLYETGRGVPQDMALAESWYRQAATGGNLRAMHNLANLYAEGLVDGQRNYTEATRWFAEAASYGIVDSQYNLGVIFERGIGVRADINQAYLWYSIAAANGDADAVERRDGVASQLESATRSEIDAAVREWRPRTADPEANGRISISRPMGASTNEIATAQDLLNRLGFTAGTPDGIMGPRTAEAIRQFEQRAGLNATGRVSAALLSRLEAAVNAN